MANAEPELLRPHPTSLQKLTIGDLAALVVGFALAFALWEAQQVWWSQRPLELFILYHTRAWSVLQQIFVGFSDALTLAPVVLVPAILAQRRRFQDDPRPAEWVMLAAGGILLETHTRGVRPYVQEVLWTVEWRSPIGLIRLPWNIEELALCVCCVGTLLLVLCRRQIGPMGRSASAVALIALLAAGPAAMLRWNARSEIMAALQWGIRHGTGGLWSRELRWLTWAAANSLATFPLYLILALPWILMLRSARKSPRRWTETASRVLIWTVTLVWILCEIGNSMNNLFLYGAAAAGQMWLDRFLFQAGMFLALLTAWLVVRSCRWHAVAGPMAERVEDTPPDVAPGS